MRGSPSLAPVVRGLVALACALSLLPSCAQDDTSDIDEDATGQELRAFLEGAGPIPDAAGREQHRRTLARLAVRGSGLRRALAEEGESAGDWTPVVEQTEGRMLAADVRPWVEAGDIDADDAFVPVSAACVAAGALDMEGVPDEVRGPELEQRASRLACSVERLTGGTPAIEWAPGLSAAVVVDAVDGSALVNPRLLPLIEPASDPPPAGGGASPGGGSQTGSLGKGASPGETPTVQPQEGENGHHPRPPATSSGSSGSSRTVCDRVCDDIWNDVFDCDCGGNPGNDGGGNGCDCGSDTSSSGNSCGGGACKCETNRGGKDRAGIGLSLFMLGTLVLRRRRRPRAPVGSASSAAGGSMPVVHRRSSARNIVFPAVMLGLYLLACAARALAGPPARLVDVHVSVTPPEAALFVDGNAVVPAAGIVRVPAGSHTFSAKLEGYADASQNVLVADQGTGTLVTLHLVADKGFLNIQGRNPTLALLIDGNPVGKGTFSGLVAPGRHVVTAVDERGQSRSWPVDVVAGRMMILSTDAPPGVLPPPPLPPPSPPATASAPPARKAPEKPRAPARTGPYVLVNATMLWQTARPYAFEHKDAPAPGFAIGGRGGYRVSSVVGVEALLEYGRISNGGFVSQTYQVDQNNDGAISGGEGATDRSPADYTLESFRFGPQLRLASEGAVDRFVGGIGLGALHENIGLDHVDLVWSAAQGQYLHNGTFHHDYEGWSPYLLLEGGYERSIGAFLAGLSLQLTVESVSGITGDPYNSGLQARLGLCLRGGYAAW